MHESGRWDSNPRPSPWQGDVLPLYYARRWPFVLAENAESQDRTGDTTIFSRVLYQLSYLGPLTSVQLSGEILHAERKIVKQRAISLLQGFYNGVISTLPDGNTIDMKPSDIKGD